MKNSLTILVLLIVLGCGTKPSNEIENSYNSQGTAKSFWPEDSIKWTKFSKYFEFNITADTVQHTDSNFLKIEYIGLIDRSGDFHSIDSVYEKSYESDSLFGHKGVDSLILENPNVPIYFKIKTDYLANQRSDLLRFIILNPAKHLSEQKLLLLRSDLEDLTFVKNIEMVFQENELFQSDDEPDSTLFIQITLDEKNNNVDSLKSKIELLTKDKRIENAFYNDLLEQTREQYLIMKITHHNNG